MFANSMARINAEACVPEQLSHYVEAVSGRQGILCQGYPAYIHERHAVLVAYPGSFETEAWALRAAVHAGDPEPTAFLQDFPVVPLASALERLSGSGCSKVTVLAPFVPEEAASEAARSATRDCYWQLPLPGPSPGTKLRNMLGRAGREVQIQQERFEPAHAELVDYYLRTRPLLPGTRTLFASLGRYVNGSQEARSERGEEGPINGRVILLAARRPDMRLAAFAVGDFTALETAFYMFAFRYPDAPPGTADLLLAGLLRQGETLGHRRMNLGLGISRGIGFFKKKWGALPYLPYVETHWVLAKAVKKTGIGGLWRRLTGA